MIELLIASSLGLLLLMSVLNMYLGIQRSYRYQQGIARIQENGRLATRLLTDDIRMSGYFGCVNWQDSKFTNHVEPTGPLVAARGLFGQKYNLPSSVTARIKPGTDVITISKASSDTTFLKASMTADNMLEIRDDSLFESGELVLISDCEAADLFRIQSVYSHNSRQFIKSTHPLAKKYNQGAQVAKFEAILYFIGRTSSKNFNGQFINALFRKDLNNDQERPDEMLEGIDDMQIHYGIDKTSSGQVTDYLLPSQVSNWSDVRTVEIALLIDSIESVSNEFRNYTFQGITYHANDHLMYREWDLAIALRERCY